MFSNDSHIEKDFTVKPAAAGSRYGIVADQKLVNFGPIASVPENKQSTNSGKESKKY